MPQWKGKSRGTKLGYRIFVAICRKLGVYPAYFLLIFVAFYYFLFSWESSRHIYNYLRRYQKFGFLKSVVGIYRNYFVFGQTLLDRIVITSGIKNAFTYHFDGRENLTGIVEKGKGGILISAHIGNWEVAGHFLKHVESKVHIVMFDAEHQKIKDYLEEVTGGRNFDVIVIKDDLSHVYAIGDALSRNELICLHADRFLEGNKTMVKSFLGANAHFPAGPFAIAATFKVPVSFVFALKESARHYHLFGSVPIEYDHGKDKEQYITALSGQYVSRLEKLVKTYPYQWFNYYNFWAT